VKLVLDCIYYLDRKIDERTLANRMKERRKLRDSYMNTEKKKLKLEILRELGR
jgi:hypothetical protein